MATVARHQDISNRFLEHAEEEFEKGDLLQASEKTWGAVAHCVKSVARKHGWPNKSHRDVSNNADRLIRLTEDPRQNQRLFHVVTNLHVNFYEDTCRCSMIMSVSNCSMKMSVYERTDVDYEGADEDTGIERTDRGQGDGGQGNRILTAMILSSPHKTGIRPESDNFRHLRDRFER